jgi:hypothetical protein
MPERTLLETLDLMIDGRRYIARASLEGGRLTVACGANTKVAKASRITWRLVAETMVRELAAARRA